MLQRPDNYRLAFLLGIAIGVMASLSILEMFLHNALENGFGVTPSFIAGAAAFYFANPYFPEFDVSGLSKVHSLLDSILWVWLLPPTDATALLTSCVWH